MKKGAVQFSKDELRAIADRAIAIKAPTVIPQGVSGIDEEANKKRSRYPRAGRRKRTWMTGFFQST